MKKDLNLIIFITGLAIFISNLIIGHHRCITVGLSLIVFSFINSQIPKIKDLTLKIFLLSILYWIVRFTSVSIPTSLNFYDFSITKLVILLILVLFLFKLFAHHRLNHQFVVISIFLVTNFILDFLITYRFDPTIFLEPFFYLTLLPILLI
jgi:hypothetical protein